ncbi:MAG: hypothetical protein M1835_005739 [Candelina submexicana]|nr:MAG: hypothetical protein M1835_005739 [Candelina submexicana]
MTSALEPSRRNPHTSLRERPAYPDRNKPLFTKRPPQYEFFTDSLNESLLQSPSPPKRKEEKKPSVANPPRISGGARTLNAAFRATAGIRDENRPPSSSSSERKRTQFVPKPRPSQTTSQRTPPRPAGGQRSKEPTAVGRDRTNTKVSAASSTPSPPRGLREAYNRIVDEENLAAHQHDSEDEEREEQRHELGSPDVLKAPRRNSPVAQSATPFDAPIGMEGLHEVAAGHGSESEPTFSGMSFIDNMTDDTFGKALADHARDEQRMSGALKSNGQIFRKAHVGERAGLTLENLQRRDQFDEAKAQETLGRAGEGSVNSDWSDPPVHVPNTWGRKGRAGKEWLNRINEPGGKLTGDLRSPVIDVTQPRENANEDWKSAKIDWISAAAEVPLPSVEEGSSLRGKSPRASTPSSSGKRDISLDRLRQWDIENDFTARSIQISTSPVLKTRNNTLDQIREREIESLKGRAVTTNRLDEIRERSSEQQSRRPSAAGSDVMKDKEKNSQRTAATKIEISKEITVEHVIIADPDVDNPKYHEFEEGDPIPNTPIIVFKNRDKGSDKSQSPERTLDDNGTPKGVTHDRQDSRDLLRKLARAASASPSSTNDLESKDRPQAVENVQKASQPLDPRRNSEKPDAGTGDAKSKSQPPETIADEEKLEAHHSIIESLKPSRKEEVDRENLAINTEDILAASGIEVISHKSGTEIDPGKTPKASQPAIPLKTPIVTGAWVDTPAPTVRQHPVSPPSDLDVDKEISALGIRDFIRGPSSSPLYRRSGGIEGRPMKDEGPIRPKSALAAIVSTSRAHNKAAGDDERDENHDGKVNDEEALGESTIDSLEDLIANDTSFSSLLDFNDKDLESITPRGKGGQTLSTPERERKLEMLAYERMNQRLKALRLSIRDAKRGIEGLEHKVEDAPAEIWPCPTCGCSSGGQRLLQRQRSSWRRHIPSLYTWSDRGWLRPTWLGWLLFAVGAWCISEYTLCEIYCQPRYAYWMEGYGVNIHAPRMPWVTATMIWRPLSWFLLPIWKVLTWVTWQVYGQDAQQAQAKTGGSMSKGAGRDAGYHFEKRNGVIFKVWDDVHDLGATYPRTDTYTVKNTYSRKDTNLVKDTYSQEDKYDRKSVHTEDVPVASDTRIPRPSWGPDLSMMDDEYL